MRYLLTVAGAAHLGSIDELCVSRLTAPEDTGASTKTLSLYDCGVVLSVFQIAREQALQTAAGFAIVRVLLLQRGKS
jgi:hypothetical protein